MVSTNRRVIVMDMKGVRRKGRLKWRWVDSMEDDLRKKGLSGETGVKGHE